MNSIFNFDFLHEDEFTFATDKDKKFINLLSKHFDIFLADERYNDQISYTSKSSKHISLEVNDFQLQLHFRLDQPDKILIINLNMELEHSLNYFLITTRLTPYFIKQFYNQVLIGNPQIFETYTKTNIKFFDCENLLGVVKTKKIMKQ